MLIGGINSYIEPIKKARIPFFTTWTTDPRERDKEYEAWRKENESMIHASLDAQEKYCDEAFAMSNLAGALLQLAAMCIQKYSEQESPPDIFKGVIKPKSIPAKFNIGRLVKDIPMGLIIYAGRNQFNHHNEDDLREPSLSIFETMCEFKSPYLKGQSFRDPAFDLNNELIDNYAHNITALLEWERYEKYEEDMLSLFE